MENLALLDFRAVFLNMVLFGTKTVPDLAIDSFTSDEFIKLLKTDDNDEKDAIFNEISIKYLSQLNELDRISLIDFISYNEIYCEFLFILYTVHNKDKHSTKNIIKNRIYDDLMRYKNKGDINFSVMHYFKFMLDRLTLFNFSNPGKISKEEYKSISFQLLSNNLDKYFLE